MAAVVLSVPVLLAACSSSATPKPAPSTAVTSTTKPARVGTSRAGATTTTMRVTTTGVVLVPGQVDSIVASDTAINNRANAALSIPLQDSHETCLQEVLDDATYRGDIAAGSNTLGGSFDQVPDRAFVPREDGYPASFSVLAADEASGQPTTHDLLTYVKVSPSARWKLAFSSEILGPSDAGVTVPAAATESGGYVTDLDPASNDGLVAAPDGVPALVARAFTSESVTGRLPNGVSARFGPNDVSDPHTVVASYASAGAASAQFTATTPAAAVSGRQSGDCPYPAIRLADGGALVGFPLFMKLVVHVSAGNVLVQPSDRSALGPLLAPGSYSSFTALIGDMAVAVVPPAGSSTPLDVIGQATEDLTESGVRASGADTSGGPKDAPSIAKKVDPALVDVDTTLNYENEEAAGTGMALTSNGEVLTNNHVIDGATSISVRDIGNGNTYAAKVVGYDATSDVAVLQLQNASGLRTVRLGNSAGVRVGEAVVGIGNAGAAAARPAT